MNKREFVLASGGALATGGGWAAVASGASRAQTNIAADGSLIHWRGRVGERFEVFGATRPVQLVLQRVDERAGDPRTSQFSLLFEAAGAPPAAGAQVLRSAISGGALALFLDQAGADGQGSSLLRADFCQLA
jgi:hypothetical protein